LFFALGTSYATLPAVGHVWYLLQVVTVMMTLLAYLAAFSNEHGRAFFLTGLAVGGLLMTRLSAAPSVVFLAWYLLSRHWRAGPRRLLGFCLLGLLPVALSGGLLAAYNFARFGSLTDVGLAYHLVSDVFRADFLRYGAFNLHYVPTNVYYQYIFYPFPIRLDGESSLGGSLFLLSPLFFAAFFGIWTYRRRADTWALLLSILLGTVPILLLMGTGFLQFGPRYTLDFTIPLLLLTALGISGWRFSIASLLTGVSVLHYLAGAIILGKALYS
jgi:hypothetical protein